MSRGGPLPVASTLGALALVLTAGLNAMPAARAAAPATGPASSLAAFLGHDGLIGLEGRVWDAAALEGRVVLLDAWATWCAPCLAELPRLRVLSQRYADDFVVLGLSLDTMPRRDFESWLRRQDVGWPQVFDGRGYGSPAAVRLGLDRLPASWLFDPEGGLVAADLRGAALEAVVGALVKGQRPR